MMRGSVCGDEKLDEGDLGSGEELGKWRETNLRSGHFVRIIFCDGVPLSFLLRV